MKAQIQVISIILITGIVISLVGAAYFWGSPLIEKRAAVTEVQIAESFISGLNDRIISIANAGTGEASLDIPHGLVRVIPNDSIDPDNNSVVLEFIIQQQMIFPNTVAYIDTSNIEEIAPYGEAQPRIITLRGEGAGQGNKLFLKLHYRELDINITPVRGYKIALNDNEQEITGNSRITVSFIKRDTIPNGAANGGDMIITHISLVVV